MKHLKSFNEHMNQSEWIGPAKILKVDGDLVTTKFGTFKNQSGNRLTVGYYNLLKVENDIIIETGMSCVDLIIIVDNTILTIKRGGEPFKGYWALPGGIIDEGEQPIDAAVRELQEETNLTLPKNVLQFVGKFDKPYRDPRNKNCISYAFKVYLDEIPETMAGDDATECVWNKISLNGEMIVDMAFDHKDIIKKAIVEGANEMMYQDKFDYDHIISILKKTHGWGFGIVSSIDEFEDNEEYFLNPIDDNDYAEQFHIFLTDKETGQLRGQFQNKTSLRMGKWKTGIQVASPVSIYNKLT
jgi:8-oxo-dGTP diphosphatase